MHDAILLAPTGGQDYLTSSGKTYRSDVFGVLRDVPWNSDLTDLQACGCHLIHPGRWPQIMLRPDMTTTDDQLMESKLLSGTHWYLPRTIVAVNATGDITSLTGGASIFTGPNKTGDQVGYVYFNGMDGTNPKTYSNFNISSTPVCQGPVYFKLVAALPKPPGDQPAPTVSVYLYGD